MSKVAFITGAVRNSGFAIAEKFASEGYDLCITSRVAADAEAKAKELTEEFGVPCYGFGFSPLNAKAEVQPLFEKLEAAGLQLDSISCNAADLGRWMNPLEVEAEAWINTLNTNVVGYFLPAREAARQMVKNGKQGTIIFIGSVNYKDALPDRSAYVASKGAIRSMTKALAIDFAKYGIRVNCIAPGPIWTNRYEEMDPAEAEQRRKLVPLQTISTPENIGNIAYFLATDTSQNMTGSVVVVDGGMDCLIAGGY